MNHDGHFPTRIDELVEPDELGYRYLGSKTRPLDPWGREYVYLMPEGDEPEPDLITLGEDGEIGGTGDDEDIDLRTLMKELESH